MKKIICVCLLLMGVAACTDKVQAPAEGRRSVGVVSETLRPDRGQPALAAGKKVSAWPMRFQNAGNRQPSVRWNGTLKPKTLSVGRGLSGDRLTMAGPIVLKHRAYTLDSHFQLQATDIATGKRLFRTPLAEITGTVAHSIGLASDGHNLYAVAGDGTIVATDLTGKEQWRMTVKAPLRSAPVVAKGTLFVSAINNRVFAVDTRTGREKWHYDGEPTVTNFFGMGTPAVSGDLVIVPMTNGRINAFDRATGVLVWTEILWSKRTYNQIMDIPHITASPVVDGDTVYLVGNAGKSGAWRVADGTNIWTAPIGGRETPAISGNALFLMTNTNRLVALNKKTGRVFWERELPTQKRGEWYGPVVSGTELVLASSAGDVVFLNAKTGREVRRTHQGVPVGAPVIADGALMTLMTDGDLVIYK